VVFIIKGRIAGTSVISIYRLNMITIIFIMFADGITALQEIIFNTTLCGKATGWPGYAC